MKSHNSKLSLADPLPCIRSKALEALSIVLNLVHPPPQ